MNLRSRIVLAVFGSLFATSPVFAEAPAPQPDPTHKVDTGKTTTPARLRKEDKANKLHIAPNKLQKAPAPTPQKTQPK